MAVKEPENLTPEPERHGLGCPCEAHPGPALAPRSEDNWLFEWPERYRYLEHDPVLLELTPGGQVRFRAVAKWLDDDLVSPGTGKPFEDAPRLGI